MSSHPALTPALSMRGTSSSRSTSAGNEQKTCPQMVASVLWKMGRAAERGDGPDSASSCFGRVVHVDLNLAIPCVGFSAHAIFLVLPARSAPTIHRREIISSSSACAKRCLTRRSTQPASFGSSSSIRVLTSSSLGPGPSLAYNSAAMTRSSGSSAISNLRCALTSLDRMRELAIANRIASVWNSVGGRFSTRSEDRHFKAPIHARGEVSNGLVRMV